MAPFRHHPSRAPPPARSGESRASRRSFAPTFDCAGTVKCCGTLTSGTSQLMSNVTGTGRGLSTLTVEDALCRTAVLILTVPMGPEAITLKVITWNKYSPVVSLRKVT